jgi:hypothetical protein
MSRVHRMTVVHDEAVIAFLLFCLRSIRQSKNVNESCTEKDPDVAVRAIRVIWLAGRSATAVPSL